TSGLKRIRQGNRIRLLTILAGIWLFSLLAGGSPSVVRSAVMFSCIATGNAISKTSSVYNSLAGSAFLLLAYNPYWLWDTGFQLSYSAVLSIIIFQSPVYGLLDLRNRMLVIVWKTCAVTISAQILTTPVSIFYFHQFPLLFLLTNFIAIPLSSLILIFEIALCLLAPFPFLAGLTGRLTGHLIYFMNMFVEFVDRLPNANWRGLQISYFQCLVMFIAIAACFHFILSRKFIMLFTSLSALAVFFSARTLSFYQAGLQEKLIIYNIPKQSAIELIRGRNALFIADSGLLKNPQHIRFHILPSRILHRIERIAEHDHHKTDDLVFARNNFKMLRITGAVQLKNRVNVLIVSGNARGNIESLVRGVLPDRIVFDCSNSRMRIASWLGECRKLGIPAWSVPDQGAF
ncbi:MAG: ComEC/Rec2 family competence protein, partial [Sphingobacteriales bacterium]